MALSEADVVAGRAARQKRGEPRLTSSHFSTRQRTPCCQADKVKHCGELKWMARAFIQFNDFINPMSQMLTRRVLVMCHSSWWHIVGIKCKKRGYFQQLVLPLTIIKRILGRKNKHLSNYSKSVQLGGEMKGRYFTNKTREKAKVIPKNIYKYAVFILSSVSYYKADFYHRDSSFFVFDRLEWHVSFCPLIAFSKVSKGS